MKEAAARVRSMPEVGLRPPAPLRIGLRRLRAGSLPWLCVALATGCQTPPATPPPAPRAALDATCLATARQQAPPPRALAMAHAARREHEAWGAQAMDDAGRLTESGSSEAEDTPRSLGEPAPWQRVMTYWRAVDPESGRLPYVVRYGALRRADREALQGELARWAQPPQPEPAMGSGPPQPGLAPESLRALQVALDRVAVVDTPWSAAFIGWLAREAGLGADEFAFSEAHADYAGAAWRASQAEAAGLATSHAMRACDVERTPPRVGDLICQTRGRLDDAGAGGFDPTVRALAARAVDGAALPMHCDLVTDVDDGGFTTVGGNLLQSVTRRRLAFAPGTRVLDPSYLSQRCATAGAGCTDRHMSRQPWALLLQWR